MEELKLSLHALEELEDSIDEYESLFKWVEFKLDTLYEQKHALEFRIGELGGNDE